MNKRHQRANECHRSQWEQCRIERSRRDICEKYSGRAHQSPSIERFLPKALIPPNIDPNMKMIPSPNDFVCKSAAPNQAAQQENYKLVI